MKTARFWVVWAGVVCLALTPSLVANDDIVTLKSGEEIVGRITSENDAQLVIEVPNARRTIFSARSVSKSEIKSVQRETQESKIEKLAYEATQHYKPNPDQEFTATQCDTGLADCQKFLKTYPTGEHATAVRLQIDQLQKEKEQVEKGLVKFGNMWMSANQKTIEQDLRASLVKVQRIQRDLASLEKQRESAIADIASEKGGIAKESEAVKNTYPTGYYPGYAGSRNAAIQQHNQAVQQRDQASELLGGYQAQLAQSTDLLALLESKLSRARSDLATAQRDYDAAKVKHDSLIAGSQQQTQSSATASPTVPITTAGPTNLIGATNQTASNLSQIVSDAKSGRLAKQTTNCVAQCEETIRQYIIDGQAQYIEELDVLAKSCQAKGELDDLLAVKNEQKRITTSGRIEANNLVQKPSELLALQVEYKTFSERIGCATAAGFVNILEERKRHLTIAGQVEDAIIVKNDIDRIRQRYCSDPVQEKRR